MVTCGLCAIVVQMRLRRWYTGTWWGRPAFVKVVPAGAAANREAATLTKLQALPQCRVVRLLHVARVTLAEPHSLTLSAPVVAIVTVLAPHGVFSSEDERRRLHEAVELLEVRHVQLGHVGHAADTAGACPTGLTSLHSCWVE